MYKTIAAPKQEKRIYTDWELTQFDSEISKWKKTKISPRTGKSYEYFDEREFLICSGALNSEGDVIVKNLQRDEYDNIIGVVIPYRDLSEKISQWRMWKARNNFVERKLTESLEKMQ